MKLIMISLRRNHFKICNEVIHPGESVSLALKLPELYSCLPAYMPVKVFHGKKSGPVLLVFAAVNGDEVNGTEIIHRLVNLKRLKKISGTLIAVPVVNVFGLVDKSKFLPGHVDLSTIFPGSAHGTHADRMANLFITELFDIADYAISLETGPLNYSNFPEILVDLDIEESKNLAKNFGAPVVNQATGEAGTLVHYASRNHKKLLTYTAGEACRLDSRAIKIGLRGILNTMSMLDMLPGKEVKMIKPSPVFFLEKSSWVRTSYSGISSNQIRLGDFVKKHHVLSVIRDPFGNADKQTIVSPKDGVIVGINNVPLVNEGDALFKIAAFPESKLVEEHLKNWESSS